MFAAGAPRVGDLKPIAIGSGIRVVTVRHHFSDSQLGAERESESRKEQEDFDHVVNKTKIVFLLVN